MRKKGTTESYSALIGIIIAVLMLTAIGCAVYNMYKPKGTEYFDKLVSHLKKMEESNLDEEDGGEMAFYVEKDKFLVGFGKGKDYVGCKGLCSVITWSCHGIDFGWAVPSPMGPASSFIRLALGFTGSIDRPKDKCPDEKSCLCLCDMSRDEVKQSACTGIGVKCETFDNLDFYGGEGCSQGVFIPGTKYTVSKGAYERGMRVIQYIKKGPYVSLDDNKALLNDDLKKKVEQETQSAFKMSNVIISSSCGKDNDFVSEELSMQLKTEGITTSRVDIKSEDGACMLPDMFAKEVSKEYPGLKYFIQIEKDDSITDYNTIIISYYGKSSQSLTFAEEIQNELTASNFNVKLEQSKDEMLTKYLADKKSVEIRLLEDNLRPVGPIVKAIIKNIKGTVTARLLSWPVSSPRITSCFGLREGKEHAGIDLGAKVPGKMGDTVEAIGDGIVGTVVKSCPDTPQETCGGGYGNYVVVNQLDKYNVIYAHLMSDITLKEGDRIRKGQTVGHMGNSGHSTEVHLHLGVYGPENPTASGTQGSINPVCFLDMKKASGSRCGTDPATYNQGICPVLV
ncbi:M23 family metallopeptidase [Candidatus Woesearchaeota archaeon]|nr:M23 family metallopeptidase [Candidatus Woesearchaeota archaeon]